MLGDILLQLIPYRRRRVVVLDGKRYHPVLVCHFTFSLCFSLENENDYYHYIHLNAPTSDNSKQ
jgi:hypothetical protein